MKFLRNIKTFLNESHNEFEYRFLDRLKTDCEYFLKAGKGNTRHLYYGNIPEHIEEMKKIWNSLPIKPVWLSFEDILNYEERMLNYDKHSDL
jgi:hypothetical protein